MRGGSIGIALGAALAALSPAPSAALDGVVFESDALRITTLTVARANVHLVDRGDKRVMIDAGNPGDEAAYESLMREHDIAPESIDALILTHGHLDHAGTAAYFQKTWGVPVIGGQGDQPMIDSGGQDDVCPTSFTARLVLWMLSGRSYEPFALDRAIAADFDLRELGIEGEILHLPGHTPGSLVVIFDDQAFVGDLIRGGLLRSEQPAVHFFMCDLEDNRAKIRRLLAREDLRRWYPGHMGPLDVEAVRAFMAEQPTP